MNSRGRPPSWTGSPRLRGEDSFRPLNAVRMSGLPPLARGGPRRLDGGLGLLRLTPA
ncbi:hypothetical protein [Streptomyces sp. NPDC058086]|uniref:hypothetical protein n=1 Tax=Streptomyces sp. NPDC058086 TaxID=3346334 RepID=UPI0036E732B5